MQLPDTIIRFGIALLIGVLIGLEREFARLKEEVKAFAGVRTFPLIAQLGCCAALLAELTSGWAFALIAAVIGLLIAIGYAIDASQGRVGMTIPLVPTRRGSWSSLSRASVFWATSSSRWSAPTKASA